jgi:hypothetical protein
MRMTSPVAVLQAPWYYRESVARLGGARARWSRYRKRVGHQSSPYGELDAMRLLNFQRKKVQAALNKFVQVKSERSFGSENRQNAEFRGFARNRRHAPDPVAALRWARARRQGNPIAL